MSPMGRLRGVFFDKNENARDSPMGRNRLPMGRKKFDKNEHYQADGTFVAGRWCRWWHEMTARIVGYIRCISFT